MMICSGLIASEKPFNFYMKLNELMERNERMKKLSKICYWNVVLLLALLLARCTG
ncbi:hypothetical protein STZ1_60091 [Bacillus subtilis]